MEYNTQRDALIIPEYGRHIQKMVQYLVTINDAQLRNNTAKALISVLGNLNPHLRDVPDFQHKLWDHLFILSDFKLDVESPYPRPTQETVKPKPKRLDYPQKYPKYRFYGTHILKMIEVCTQWETGDLRTALEFSIANHMKKCFINWNKETVADAIIFEHLYELSGGKINLKNQEEDLKQQPVLQRKKTKKFPLKRKQ